MQKVREKCRRDYVENPEYRSLGRHMHMMCNIQMVLRELLCSDMEMIYIH
jgi:hypothetical protein